VLAGAIGIGVGFGLQNIASNFISGLIILFERPVKVGDRIEVGSIDSKVTGIGARSTTVRTNDNITIIVLNSKFISENVVELEL
jgi:small-conductance mechanosensitive channel